MVLRVLLQVFPEMVTKGVSIRRRRIEDVAQFRAHRQWLRELKCRLFGKHPFVEADNENTLAMLRHAEIRSVQNLVKHPVFLLFKVTLDDRPGASLVMRLQVLDILQNDNRRTLQLNDINDIKEQSALGKTFKSVCATEAIFL